MNTIPTDAYPERRQKKELRILLLEANDMGKWVGGALPFEVHVPPIGLMYLAAYARSHHPGADIRIVESSLHCKTDSGYMGILEQFDPDIVGIRSITFFFEEMKRLAALTRAHGKALIVAGGPIVRAYGSHLFSLVPEIEIAVRGEGEQSFVDLLGGKPLPEIRGILYRQSGQVIENPEGPEIEEIDAVPMPAYDLVDLDLYERQLSYTYNHRRQGVLLTSRGCPYSCTFCFEHSRRVRLRSAGNVFQEILELHNRRGIRDFYIIDDIFNLDLERALRLFDMIARARLGLRIYFANGLRTELVNEEFVDRAVDAGAIWFTYAIESANGEIQSLIRKKVDLEKARAIIGYTQRKGVAVNVSTMFGFPTETLQQARQTLDWLGTLPKPSLLPYHFCLRCFPGCEITKQALKAGWDPQLVEFGSGMSYHELPLGTPTLPKGDMYRILIEYHQRYGLNNQDAVRESVRTLKLVGYSDEDITHMYSVLKRKLISSLNELVGTGHTTGTADERR